MWVCVCVKERIQLSTCQPLSFLSHQPLSACALYPMVQNREGLGKPLLPSPPSSSCLCPSFLSCKCQTDSLCTIIRHTVNIPPPPPSNWVSRAGIVFCYYLTSELHILEFMCLTSPVLVWASRSVVSKSCCHCEGLRSAALDSWEWWQPRNKDTRLRPRGLHHFNVSHTHASHRFAAGMPAC